MTRAPPPILTPDAVLSLTVHKVVGPDAAEVSVAVHAVPHAVDVRVLEIPVHANDLKQSLGVAHVVAETAHLLINQNIWRSSEFRDTDVAFRMARSKERKKRTKKS